MELNSLAKVGSSIIFGNIAGLYPNTNKVKVKFLAEKAEERNSIIIALSESHLKSKILDAEIHIPGYQLFRADRQDHIKNGGVIVYVKESFANGLKLLTSGCNGVVEWLCLYLPTINAVLVNIYRPPSCPEALFKHALGEVSKAICSLGTPMPLVVICGDFNLPSIDWNSGNISGSTLEIQRQAAALFEFMNEYSVLQMVTEPTRKSNILDLFMTNNPEIISSIEVMDTLLSDHRLLLVETCINTEESLVQKPNLEGFNSLNFHHMNVEWNKLNQELLELRWEEEFQSENVSENLEKLNKHLLRICAKYVPKKGEFKRKSKIPRDRRIIMRKRARMSKQIICANARRKSKLEKKLEVLEFKLIESHKKEEREKEQRAVETIKENSRYFFTYAKTKSKVKIPIGPLEEHGNIISDPYGMSQILQNQFQSVFSQPVFSQTELNMLTEGRNQGFCYLNVSEEDIDEAIKQISSGSAPGPDGIPPVLLKECSSSLKKPISMLWNKSLTSEQIPEALKLGLIIPVHKSGSRGEAKNYRPITLTSHLIKIFERVLVKKLVEFLEEKDLFNEQQHGFRRNRSCLSQLMDHYQHILNIMETGDSADVIYLDFAKAFDKVDHGILVRKLVKIGVGGPILTWINEFLTNRTQNVKVQGSISSGAPVISGVPQGTVLGPILFLIFVGDIDGDLKHAKASSFADDTRVVMRVGTQEEANNLQMDLNMLYQWSKDNNMEFNGGKFQHLRYAPN